MKKVNYEFVTGEVVEVEVSEEWAEVLKYLDRKEYNNEKKETRRHCTMDVLGAEGEWMLDERFDPGSDKNTSLFGFENEALEFALTQIPERQRNILVEVFVNGYGVGEYAEEYGIDYTTASKLIARAKKNIKKFL